MSLKWAMTTREGVRRYNLYGQHVWCWPFEFINGCCRDTLMSIAKHYETGETLPEDVYLKLVAARTFRAGSLSLRQVSAKCLYVVCLVCLCILLLAYLFILTSFRISCVICVFFLEIPYCLSRWDEIQSVRISYKKKWPWCSLLYIEISTTYCISWKWHL